MIFVIFLFLILCPQDIFARVVRVGIYDNLPKIGLDTKGRPAGIFVDITDYIGKKEGWKIEYVYDEWDNCLKRLEAGEIDLMPDVAYSGKREKRFDFNKISVLP
ncbi:MAG: transporter substrate-binding domain-containing protein [Brevinematia bacterium]